MFGKRTKSPSQRDVRKRVPKRRPLPPRLEVLEDRTIPAVGFLGVAAGDATSSDAILWTRAVDAANPQPLALTAQVSTDKSFATLAATYAANTDATRDYTTKVDALGLLSGTRYFYRFVTSDGTTSPTGTFVTAPAPAAQVPLHFGFSGDADGKWRPYDSTGSFTAPGVPSFALQNFDYFVWLGDTIYETASGGPPSSVPVSPATGNPVTNPTQALADYLRKYREQYQAPNPGGFPDLQTFFASQGNYTLLDNHELGNQQLQSGGAPQGTPPGAGVDPTNTANDTNPNGPWLNQIVAFGTVEQAYTDYQPIRERTVNAPGDPRSDRTQQLYFSQQWGANSIFFNLDDRSYRDIRLRTAGNADDTGPRADNPNRTMLGATQLKWFEQGLLDAQARGVAWKFVAVSSPIDQIGAGQDGGKSWIGGYRAERNQMMKFIADNHIDHVVFLSTDDHLTRVNELTYLTDPNDPKSLAVVPGAFIVITGPLGAGGPDAITDHSFANIKSQADTLAAQETAAGVNPIGLDAKFPGLKNVFREGDPNADTLRQPVDFYSPDTFNYTTLDLDPTGQTLTVTTYGINSYAANTFPEPSASNPVRKLLSFQIALDTRLTGVTSTTAAGTYGSGAKVNVTLNFSKPVTLTGGNLTVKLNSGGTVTIAPFTNATTVSGTYTVAPGDRAAALDVTAPLTLAPGATLKDAGGTTLSAGALSVPPGQSLKDSKAIVINTTVLSKLGVVRPGANGVAQLSLDSSGDGSFGPGDAVLNFGLNSDTVIVGDWTGSGYDSVGVVRPTAGGVAQFSLDTNGNGTFDAGDQVFSFGLNDDTFLTGDWNGDRRTKIGVARPGANGVPVVSLDTNGNGAFDAGDQVFSFGLNGDTFLVGDWTGDGRAKIGVVRPTASGVPQIVLDTNGNGVFDGNDRVFSFGLNGDTFIVGDWTGDGRARIGLVRPGAGGAATVVLDTNGNGAFDGSDRVLTFGLNGDKFLVGRWKPAAALVAADGRRDAIVAPLAADPNFTAAVNQSIDLWAAAGLDPASVARLRQVSYSVADLGGATLGLSGGDAVVIDATAAGHGWSTSGEPDKMDLTTALAHEMGHTLGLDHSADPSDVMFESLLPGVRKAPTPQDIDALFAAGI